MAEVTTAMVKELREILSGLGANAEALTWEK